MKSGSISKTANTLNRTQPAISLAIKNLEDSLGFKLFERQGRQLTAVPEAFYFLEEATKILDKTFTLRRTMSSLQDAKVGNLNVASMPGPAAYLFPRFISQAIGYDSDIRVSLSSRSSTQIHEMAATQSIDFGFADTGPNNRERLQYLMENISGDCFCAMPRDHELAQQSVISVKDLHNKPMGGMQSNHLITQRIQTVFAEFGGNYKKIVDSQTYFPLLQFVNAGQCLVIVDPLTVATELKINSTGGGVVFRHLIEDFRYGYAVVYPSFRPLSKLAAKIKNDWIDEVLSLLEGVDANPERHASL